MATEIKTKIVNKNIKALNKTAIAIEHMKNAYVKTREDAGHTQREKSTPENDAEGKVAGAAEWAAGEIMYQIKTQGEKAGSYIKEKENHWKEQRQQIQAEKIFTSRKRKYQKPQAHLSKRAM